MFSVLLLPRGRDMPYLFELYHASTLEETSGSNHLKVATQYAFVQVLEHCCVEENNVAVNLYHQQATRSAPEKHNNRHE